MEPKLNRENLIKYRAAARLTQAELGKKAGVAGRQITRYESGGADPRPTMIHRLAEALGVNAEDLLCSGVVDEEEKPFPSQIADRFNVRLPDEMRDRITVAAKANSRTMNAEIVYRLEESFKAAQPKDEELKRLYLRVIYLLNKQKLSKAEATELKNAETAIQVLEKSKST